MKTTTPATASDTLINLPDPNLIEAVTTSTPSAAEMQAILMRFKSVGHGDMVSMRADIKSLLDFICFQDEQVAVLKREHRAMKLGLEWCEAVGHNDDCMFCGFKDKKTKEVLSSLTIKSHG